MNLFGEQEPVSPPAPARPRKPTAKQLREQAPPPRLAPGHVDDTLAAVRALGAAMMLAEAEMVRFADTLKGNIPDQVREGLAKFRSRHGSNQ